MKPSKIQIAPSILAADFGHLADEARRVADAGADSLHIDVMDGNFVPNLTIGHQAVAAINRATDLFLDVHLMVYHPFDYIERFVESGADRLTFHFEATEEVEETLSYIRRCNIQAGLSFRPETSMTLIPKYLDKCDLVLLMTVAPGFGGQAFMPEVLEKIAFVRDVCESLNLNVDIQVDGGIDLLSAAECAVAGANVFVAGTFLFSQPDLKMAIAALRAAAASAAPRDTEFKLSQIKSKESKKKR